MELAGTLGLDRGRFGACLKSTETAKRLEEEIGAAVDAGVHATPTVFVNGQQQVGSLSPEDCACLARGEVSRQHSEIKFPRDVIPLGWVHC